MAIGVIVSGIKYPLYIHFLGYEYYGVWLLLYTIVSFAQFGLIGIAPPLIKLVAEEYGHGNHKAIQEYFSTSVWMLMVIGVFVLAIGVHFQQDLALMMGLKGKNAELAIGLFIPMLIFSMGVLGYQVLNSVLAGVGRIDLSNYSQTALQMASLLLSIPLLLINKGVESLLLGNLLAYFIVFLLNFRTLKKIVDTRLFSGRFSLSHFCT